MKCPLPCEHPLTVIQYGAELANASNTGARPADWMFAFASCKIAIWLPSLLRSTFRGSPFGATTGTAAPAKNPSHVGIAAGSAAGGLLSGTTALAPML